MGERICEYINNDWLFAKDVDPAAMKKHSVQLHDMDGWERVNIPHTWNAEDCTGTAVTSRAYSEGYFRGACCYVRRVALSHEQYYGRRVFIEFAGANTCTALFVNGKRAGSHEGGYSAFRFDITKFVTVGAENVLTVYVSNAASDYIAPICDCGDFTKMGGIYRAVRLISADKLHIDLMDCGASGVYITAAPDGAVRARIRLANDGPAERPVTLLAEISGGSGRISAERELKLPRGVTEELLDMRIPSPTLWDGVRQPFLYSMKVTLLCAGEAVDSVTEQFGVRDFRFDFERGFFLNGTHTELRGVNYHQDSSGCGWAMTGKQRERDYSIIRDMGCNAVRMAHYQHAAEEYSTCDRLGLCVWTEIGIIGKLCPGEPAEPQISPEFRESALSQLRELVLQTYNHPSVVLYGMSNEIYQMSDSVFSLYEEMYSFIKEHGGGRAAAYADAQFWGKFTELPADAVGYNRYFGWYKEAGDVSQFGEWFDRVHAESMKRPLCISEYGGGGAISQHKDSIDWLTDIDPNGERHYENYQAQLHERIWAQIGRREYLWGKFVWCMFDFPSAGRKEGDTVGINDKGLCTRDRVPKDAYWFYRSVWSGAKTCRLADKRFRERGGVVPEVRAYANAVSAELFLDGESLGQGAHPDERLETVFVWKDVRLHRGENQVRVRALFPDGSSIEDHTVWIS